MSALHLLGSQRLQFFLFLAAMSSNIRHIVRISIYGVAYRSTIEAKKRKRMGNLLKDLPFAA